MANPIFMAAEKRANTAQKRVARLADLLAHSMQDMHGGHWRVSISHDLGKEFVLITQKPGGERRVEPKPEIA